MKKNIQFVGICALVFLCFGLICAGLSNSRADEHLVYVPLFHFGLALILGAWFLLGGGLRTFEASSVKRVANFGVRVSGYSAVFIGVLILVNYICSRHQFLHYDSTAEKVFTLAPQTTQVIEQLKQPVIMRGFFLAATLDTKQDELIQRIVKTYPDKIRWKLIDPEKEPELAKKYNVTQTGTIVVSHADGDSTREVRILHGVSEETIGSAILKLTRGATKTVYYLQGHGEPGLSDTTAAGYQLLKPAIEGENLVIKPLYLKSETGIPADASAILLASPKRNWLDFETKALEEYLKKGGNLLALHEPRSTADIQKLVRPYGVEVGNDVIVDQEVALFSGPSLGVQPVITDYKYHPITKGFSEGVILTIASSVRKADPPPPGVGVFELAMTSAQSWAEKNVPQVFSDNPRAVLEADDLKGPVSVAVAVERTIGDEGKENDDASKPKSRLVVIGDEDFVSNTYIRQLFNQDFFLNALNWVIGENKQVTIRPRSLRQSTKGITQGQFRLIFLITSVLLPELILIGGLWIWWERRM